MDIHLTSAQASADEKAAIDAELGQPESGWDGGQRNIGMDGRAAFGGHAADRHLLLPVLHAVAGAHRLDQPGALNYVCQRLNVPPAEAHGVASFYGMFSMTPRPPAWCTSATTSPASPAARRRYAPNWSGRSARPARPGCAARV